MASTQYFSYEGSVGNSTKTVTIPLKRIESISITNDGGDPILVKFNRDTTIGTTSRTIKAAETFTIEAAFDAVNFTSPDTGENNSFRMFVIGE